uniref:Peptidase n=1 Tax=viral metagenome TaxID=1070528 RepID=A0A6C0E6R2_9ZZZZ
MNFISNFLDKNVNHEPVNYTELCDKLDLKTGDILLMGTKNFWFSRIIEMVSQSQWSHVGMILKNPTWIDPSLVGYYLWQSGTEDFPDVESGKKKFGVRLDDLVEVLSTYDGYAAVRKLNIPNEIPDMNNKLVQIHKDIKDKPYDLDILDFLCAREGVQRSSSWLSNFSRKTNTFFCSAMVSYIYCKLGLLPKDTEWSECEPKTFSEQNKFLKLELNATLDPEIMLKKI